MEQARGENVIDTILSIAIICEGIWGIIIGIVVIILFASMLYHEWKDRH